jgi:PAS domain S-box-containing protein
VISIDIDDEMRAQEALSRSERQLQQMIDAVPTLIWCMTPDGVPCYLNKRAVDVTGLTLSDMISSDGQPSMAVIHPDEREQMRQLFKRTVTAGKPLVAKYRQRRANGTWRWVESRAEPLRDENGGVIQWYGVSVDIDDLVNIQEALRTQERELSQLIDMVPSLLWRLTPTGEPTFFSKRLIEFCGLDVTAFAPSGENRLASAMTTLFHPDDIPRLEDSLTHSLRTGESFSLNYRMRRFDGIYRWMSGRAEPLKDDQGRIVQWFGLSQDIEDQVRVEEELRLARERLTRASQAASLAELSAAIAHEVSQPLAAIVANSHACQRWLAATPPNIDRGRKLMDRIIHNANSAADVVTRIRALFRHSAGTRISASLPAVIAEARVLMVEEAARRAMQLEFEVSADLPEITFDPVQIQQVLVNLFRNGMDAMQTVDGEKVLMVRVRRAGDDLQVDVSDSGHGIEHVEKVFDPFFTTKEQGMGMGLAISRSIVEAHGGRLWASNNATVGATLSFTLPSK